MTLMTGPISQPPPSHVEIDERFVTEWVTWGMTEMRAYLAHHAHWSQWCADHNQTPY